MDEWWYARGEEQSGPVGRTELKDLLSTGKLDRNIMVRRADNEEWQPLAEVAELQDLTSPAPSPLSSQEDVGILAWPRARQWPRFFGRFFDLWLEVVVVSVFSGFVLSTYSSTFLELMDSPYFGLFFGFIIVPIALVFDAVIHTLLGNTPGKWMLNLVVTSSGTRLSFFQYLKRNLGVWTSGLALGLPVVGLFTLVYQAGRLAHGQSASYDEASAFSVRQKPSGWVRKLTFAAVFISLLATSVTLNVLDQSANREAMARRAHPNFVWNNPATDISVQVDSRWKASVEQDNVGQTLHIFSEFNGRAIIIFAMEPAPDSTIQQYVAALKDNNTENMSFVGSGQFDHENGLDGWQGYGTMPGMNSNRLHVHVVRKGQNFWRIVTIQAKPYDYSDKFVSDLKRSLWKTVAYVPSTL
jgi:uncharacterized RDD family membrane protein YckC